MNCTKNCRRKIDIGNPKKQRDIPIQLTTDTLKITYYNIIRYRREAGRAGDSTNKATETALPTTWQNF
jgi:hypothetical protein